MVNQSNTKEEIYALSSTSISSSLIKPHNRSICLTKENSNSKISNSLIEKVINNDNSDLMCQIFSALGKLFLAFLGGIMLSDGLFIKIGVI